MSFPGSEHNFERQFRESKQKLPLEYRRECTQNQTRFEGCLAQELHRAVLCVRLFGALWSFMELYGGLWSLMELY